MATFYYILLLISTSFFSFLAVGLCYWLLSRMAMLDMPEARSNHTHPVITGGGIAFMMIAVAFLVVANAPGALVWPVLMLMVVSFLDDRVSLPVSRRLLAQLAAVVIGLSAIEGPVFQGFLPMWLEYPLVVMVWIWFINLYNFMDGIDEMCITQTVCLCAGMVVLGLFSGQMARFISIDAVVVLAAVISFYPWNRHPAKMFMGDSGSIPLGFIMGYLLFNLAAQGQWAAALILPAYYLGDATYTLLRRLYERKPIWQAHSEHFYQKAVRAGHGHDVVARHVLRLNGALVVLACISVLHWIAALVCLALAVVAVSVVLIRFGSSQALVSHEVVA